jgi:hydroxypyruvate reductase
LVSLIISDVLGDPLESIASGPTVENPTTAADAIAVLRALRLESDLSLRVVVDVLKSLANDYAIDTPPPCCSVTNIVIGSNATAVEAACRESERLGYAPTLQSARRLEGPAEEVGRGLADEVNEMRQLPVPNALISGGEPTVELVDESCRGKGGRNQQLVLAALASLGDCRNLAFLSGGTDGEDGPTDAAGAIVDQEIADRAKELRLSMNDYLSRNDAYHFFESVGGLFKTGPTHTNVGDLRVAVVRND